MGSVSNRIAVIKDWLWAQFLGQMGQLFLWVPVFIGLGILVYFSVPYNVTLIHIGVGAAALLTLLYVAFTWQGRGSGFARRFVLALVFIALGFSASAYRSERVRAPIVPDDLKFVTVEGRIAQVEWLSFEYKTARLVIDNALLFDRSDSLLYEEMGAFKLRVKVSSKQGLPRYKSGDIIRGLASIQPPSEPVVPGGFDFRRFMYFRSIGGLGYFMGAPEVVGFGVVDKFGIRQYSALIERVRGAVNNSVFDALGMSGQGESAPVVAALLTGMRGAIDESDLEAMRGSGLAHMLAISGLHVGLFSAAVFFVVRLCLAAIPWVALNMPVKAIAAMTSLVGAGIYMLLAGATVPTQRAVLMLAVVLAAILIGRHAISMRLVAFAAICVLLIAPESLLSVSFQLSFAAVVALILVYGYLRKPLADFVRRGALWRHLVVYVAGVVLTSVIASLATAPFALYHFNVVALYGVLANAVAMPIMAVLIMPCAVIALFFMLVGLPFEGAFLQLMGRGVEVVLWVAHKVSDLDFSRFAMGDMPELAFQLFIISGLWLALLRGRLRLVALPLCCLAIGVSTQSSKPDLLVSKDHKIWGLWDDLGQNLYVSSFQKGRFVREIWERGLSGGLIRARHFRELRGLADSGAAMVCDSVACRAYMKGRQVSFVLQKSALEVECGWADILITHRSVDMGRCASEYVIDHVAVKNLGAHSIYVTKDKSGDKSVNESTVKVATVRGRLGSYLFPWEH